MMTAILRKEIIYYKYLFLNFEQGTLNQSIRTTITHHDQISHKATKSPSITTLACIPQPATCITNNQNLIFTTCHSGLISGKGFLLI